MFKKISYMLIVLCFAVFVSADSFQVGITIGSPSYSFNDSELVNGSVIVDGTNISVIIPINYIGNKTKIITLPKPADWIFGFDWYVEEAGIIKNVTDLGSELQWLANLSETNTSLYFKVSPPQLVDRNISYDLTDYLSFFTITTPHHFVNVSLDYLDVNNSYEYWVLYWFNGAWIYVTDLYHLNVSLGNASFWGFNTSNQSFYIHGSTSCIEYWQCLSWSDGTCGNRTCSDVNNCGTTRTRPTIMRGCPSESGGGGGGGGMFFQREKKNFSINPFIVKAALYPGESGLRGFVIKNYMNDSLNIQVSLLGLDKIDLILNNDEILVEPFGEALFTLKLDVPEDAESDQLYGTIVFEDSGFQKNASVIVDVLPLISSLQMIVKVHETYAQAEDFEKVIGSVQLKNNASDRKVSGSVVYSLYGIDGKQIFSRAKAVSFSRQVILDIDEPIGIDIIPGFYIFLVEASIDGNTAMSSTLIKVESELKVIVKEEPFIIVTEEREDNIFILVTVFFGTILMLAGWIGARFASMKKELREQQDFISRIPELVIGGKLKEADQVLRKASKKHVKESGINKPKSAPEMKLSKEERAQLGYMQLLIKRGQEEVKNKNHPEEIYRMISIFYKAMDDSVRSLVYDDCLELQRKIKK